MSDSLLYTIPLRMILANSCSTSAKANVFAEDFEKANFVFTLTDFAQFADDAMYS